MKVQYKSDVGLLIELKNGNESAFRFCYKEYLPIVRGWLRRNNGTDEDADDLFQEALLVLYDKVKKDELELSSKLSTYLLSICKYKWYNKQRKISTKMELELSEGMEKSEDIETDVAYFEEQEKAYNTMDRALAQLGSPCKELLEAYYLNSMNMQEISELMDYTNANNAKTQKYKCLNRLKKIYKKLNKTDEQFRLI